MNPVIRIILWALAFYAAYCLVLFFLQRQMIFPRYHIGPARDSWTNIPGMEKNWIETSAGKIETWFLPPVKTSGEKKSPAVIFAHGNAELIDFCPGELIPLTQLGIGVLLVEYPGYGRSKGSPSQKSITEAFVMAYDTLSARKDVDSSRIVLFGRSIGGAVVCALADKRPSAAMILVSTPTSVKSFALRYFVPGFLVRDPFENLSVVKYYLNPILFIHGKYDDIIPYGHGRTLYKAAKKGRMITYNCGHNDCPPDVDIYWKDVGTFLQEAGILK